MGIAHKAFTDMTHKKHTDKVKSKFSAANFVMYKF